MLTHREIAFETEVCSKLSERGWIYADASAPEAPKDWKHYDRKLALYPDDVIAWLAASQPKEWAEYEKAHKGKARERILGRLSDVLNKDGSLAVLRHGIKDVSHKFDLCQFKPAFGLNPATLAKYDANKLRVVRQVRYSLANENSIDLVLFVNGIPVATSELKTDFTQDIEEAVWQYKLDRDPKPKGQAEEPLLAFKRRAIAHFAVSTQEVRMTTKLEGKATRFLPFNLGNDGGAGNPENPASGYRTAYLWEEVWARDSFLDILGRKVILETKKEKGKDGVERTKQKLIFPRYHQLDCVRKIDAAVRAEKAGHKYLIQHSAGSGKTNTISWLAHLLATLHDESDKRVFDSVLVITDRTVLDDQLQDAIYQIEHKRGMVACITRDEGSKSAQLIEALEGGRSIIICTIQTFPAVLASMRDLADTKGKTFAVIADEAHSSQTGQAAAKLKKVLSKSEDEEVKKELDGLADGGEVDIDTLMLADMAERADPKGISYFAFTATPKAKTLELFGRPPNPKEPAGPGNLPEPFHLYTMQQAIEEGFILDVLKNYTSYKAAFRLATGKEEYDEKSVEKSEAVKSLMRWVRLHPHNISQKVALIIEHFIANVQWRLDGKAKAMVVCGSRKEAVRYKMAFDKYAQAKGYGVKALVAFSGEITDPNPQHADETPIMDPVTERSASLNPDLRGRDIRDAFDTDDFQVLLVANKYQTGFDQPLLAAMYVDKRLDGIQAVQTLSRLNRTYPGKDVTFILDFVNDPEEILAAFKPYYRKAELADVSDPNLIHEIQTKLDDAGICQEEDIERCIAAFLKPKSLQSDYLKALDPAADRFEKRWKAAKAKEAEGKAKKDAGLEKEGLEAQEALLLFKRDLASFLKLYDFLSQIFNYADTALEKRSIAFKLLLPLLKAERSREKVDLGDVVMTHHALRNKGEKPLVLGDGEKLPPITGAGSGGVAEKIKVRLSEILAKVNELFEGQDLTEADRINYINHLRDKMLESDILAKQAASNAKDQFKASPDFNAAMTDAIIGAYESHKSMSEQALKSETVRAGLADLLLDLVWQGFQSRKGGAVAEAEAK